MKKTLSAVLAASILMSTAVFAQTEELPRTLSVSGTYTVSSLADEAYINIGVKTTNVDYKLCQEENKIKMNDVIQAIKGSGIEERFIKTTSYVSNPVYDYVWDEKGGQKRTFKEYEIVHSLMVTLSDMSLVGPVIDVTVEKGINELNNVQFALTKPKQHELYLEALAGASSRAKDKAEVLAKAFGIGAITVQNITVSDYNISPYVRNYSANFAVADESYDSSSGKSTTITGGEMEVTANVTVSYTYQ